MHDHPSIQQSEYSVAHALAPATYLVPMTTGFSDPEDDDSDDGSESWKHLPPPSPTKARPGTPEKLAILAERYEAGRDLWHDDDVTVFPKNLYRVEM